MFRFLETQGRFFCFSFCNDNKFSLWRAFFKPAFIYLPSERHGFVLCPTQWPFQEGQGVARGPGEKIGSLPGPLALYYVSYGTSPKSMDSCFAPARIHLMFSEPSLCCILHWRRSASVPTAQNEKGFALKTSFKGQSHFLFQQWTEIHIAMPRLTHTFYLF